MRGVGEPPQVGEVVVAGQARVLAQVRDEERPARAGCGGVRPLVADGAGGGLAPVGGGRPEKLPGTAVKRYGGDASADDRAAAARLPKSSIDVEFYGPEADR
ncbi:hypothetical protein ACGF8B_40800 [Streptomyces sp. NPDC047917]|uniref:hypothetical protein n=1 Tax=Streptomyces sp. NPDC047917 TaxID=3365491 RepID=UPI0037119CA5